MDSLNSHSRHANQSSEQPQNLVSFALLMNRGLGSRMDSQQPRIQLPLWISLDEHRMQVDQILQTHNEQVRLAVQQQIASQNETLQLPLSISLGQHMMQVDLILQTYNEQVRLAVQQQIALQNETVLNLTESMARDALVQKNEEIAHVCMEQQNTQALLQAASRDRDEWMYLATGFYERCQLLISQLPPMQATNAHANGSSIELESTASSRNQAPNMEGTAVGRTHPTHV
ncbi:hypothetical protein BAE44_0022452, partial [Dichanthelium oligosanthes]